MIRWVNLKAKALRPRIADLLAKQTIRREFLRYASSMRFRTLPLAGRELFYRAGNPMMGGRRDVGFQSLQPPRENASCHRLPPVSLIVEPVVQSTAL